MVQLDLFASTYDQFEPKGKLRLIEFFAGIGAQARALENLGVDFISHRVCEWSCKSIRAYRAIHVKEAPSKELLDKVGKLSIEELIDAVRGVSMDYSKPMTDDQLRKKGKEWLQELYVDMLMIGDTCPDISRLGGKDLGIENENGRKDTYLMTYSFPCTDISNAGKMEGMEKGSGTRSGLLWEVERILLELRDMECRPDVLLMENVPGVCGSKNLKPWNDWLQSLHKMGYTNYFSVLNSKDYGIPQNRERCFMVSILGEKSYEFPRKVGLRYRLKDFLDEEIDSKYNLSEKVTSKFMRVYEPKGYSSIDNYNKKIKENPETSNTLTARYQVPNHGERIVEPIVCEPRVRVEGSLGYYGFRRADDIISKEGCSPTILTHGERIGYSINVVEGKKIVVGKVNDSQSGTVLSAEGICQTLMARDYKDPAKIVIEDENAIVVPENTKQGYQLAHEGDGIYTNRVEQKRGTVQRGSIQTIKANNSDIAVVDNGLRIRRLTPFECGKLMSFDRSDFERMYDSGLSESALYHSAGDSIVTTVLMGLFGSLLGVDYVRKIEAVADRIATEKGRK
jgi:DNA (cytosine-5)-methyltransferase 1